MRNQGLHWGAMLLIGALCLTGSALAQELTQRSPEALHVERREQLVKLWGTVRFRHPSAFSKPADWDAAFVAAMPKVEAARDDAAYAAAVQGMLAALGDPATKVDHEAPPAIGPAPALRGLKTWEKDVLVLDLRNLLGAQARQGLQDLRQTLDADAAKARVVVLDLRMRGLQRYGPPWVLPQVLPHLVGGELRVPGMREVVHVGLKPQNGDSSLYFTEFAVAPDDLIEGTPGKKPSLLVFLVDEGSAIDPAILALQANGKALLVAEGPLDDSAINMQETVALGGGYRALVSVNESVLALSADISRPARARMDGADEGMRQALALAARPPKRKAPTTALLRPAGVWRPEPGYENAPYPSREQRLLAGAKLWTVVRYFFPYTHLMDQPWESRLPGLLQKLEEAPDAKAYALALAEAGTWLQDGHVVMRGHPELQRFFGVGPQIWVTDIDGKAVVLEVRTPEAAPGLAVGDVIEKVNGEPMEARVRRFAPYTSGATPASLRDTVLRRALSGAEGTTSTLTVRGAQGPKDVKLTHQSGWTPPATTQAPYRILEGNIGFVDFRLLEAWQVPEVFEKLKGTRGIVFDLRNYPRGSMWALGPYIDVKGSRPYAQYERPMTGGMREGRQKLSDAVPASETPKYRGRTVTLIDTRTMSQAEHTGLMLEATADTRFLGSATAGTNGDITHAVLPGGIQFTFTGQEVRHGDGRQLQRKGLVPHVKLRPTVAGLQVGRDELLERAIQLLRDTPAP
ncbi:Peptidase, S41 family [Myxococcus hansupus]|uniref:Peptidase, S41 family n=2 Tax=Pseudomyxococcus hansupus TaxID=1297742 RepID=A0A0H4WST6_9BACT|nr:Peptidase, S41 family [Myxococcus hansupus]